MKYGISLYGAELLEFESLIIDYLLCEISYKDLQRLIVITLEKAWNLSYFRQEKHLFTAYCMKEWLLELEIRKN